MLHSNTQKTEQYLYHYLITFDDDRQALKKNTPAFRVLLIFSWQFDKRLHACDNSIVIYFNSNKTRVVVLFFRVST